MTGRATGLVLAGGLAERMGACKALLPLNGTSALETIVSRMREAGVADVVVVTGAYEEKIKAEANRLGCFVAHNPDYRTGMFSSILAGVRALFSGPSGAEAFFLLPVDTPMVKAATYRTLAEAFFERCGGLDVAYPTFRGERGHPPLIGRALAAPILEWGGERGLRGLLESHPCKSLDVRTVDRATLLDMDTPDDYAALGAYAASEFFPDDGECAELLEIAGTPERVALHAQTVARVAATLSDALEKSDLRFDGKKLRAACLLHDIAKGRADHEAEGARWLRARGYGEIADLVGAHRDLPARTGLGEAELLYLADKVTDGTRVAPLEARAQKMKKRFAPGSEALEAALARLSRAAEIQRTVERAAGAPLQKILAALC